jgi:hypothetical protein
MSLINLCESARAPIWGAREGHVPPLENVKNLEKLLTMIRIYLFKYNLKI